MKLTDLSYDLPPERIAQRPLRERDASRMLLLDRISGHFEDHCFRELPQLLRGDELMVLNDAKVLPARIFGHRRGLRAQAPGRKNPANRGFLKANIEVLLVRPLSDWRWEALVKPGRKIQVGEQIVFASGELEATVEGRGQYGLRILRFTPVEDFSGALLRLGHIPLPPYIKRADEPNDRERYQTVYARKGVAVAAPTAGLHFTQGVLRGLQNRGVEVVKITLDVGLGTFEPIRTERLEEHQIHKESYEITEATAAAINRAVAEKRPILSVGTTVVRALEDAALKTSSKNVITPGKYEAGIFLYPGKSFHVVTQLLTNFHLPLSSLLALVAAFAGRENVLRAYRHAVESGYRFYSYGDCMLIR